MKRQGTKLLGLSLLAIVALMAMGAGAAQAETTSVLVAGKALGTGEKAIEGTVGATNNDLLTGAGIEIGCTGGAITGTLKGNGTGKAKIDYSGCTVLTNSHCEVYPSETDDEKLTNKKHIVASGEAETILHNGIYYLLLTALTGKPFTSIYFHDLGGCTLPLEEEVTGRTAVRILTPETEAKTHTVDTLTAAEETLLKSLFANFGLFLGGETAMLKEGASATVELSSKENYSLMMIP